MRPVVPYPTRPLDRDRWIAAQRGPKNRLDPQKPYAMLWEEEIGVGGGLVSTATVFLTNRECPYHCLMCDLWTNALDRRVPSGAIASQIRHALAGLPSARQIKLYNAGSFFDPQAIPPEDYAEIAETVSRFERVIVECHPKLIGQRTLRFRNMLCGKLEVAIGLETIHTDVLDKLNKRFTVDDFQAAAAFLHAADIDLRVFLLLRPPFLSEAEGLFWAKCSLDSVFDAGATACCLIPTRAGNGAMDALAAMGDYAPPQIASLEAAQEYGLGLKRGRVFVDLWDIERFASCACAPNRATRLDIMNRTQQVPPSIDCDLCGQRPI